MQSMHRLWCVCIHRNRTLKIILFLLQQSGWRNLQGIFGPQQPTWAPSNTLPLKEILYSRVNHGDLFKRNPVACECLARQTCLDRMTSVAWLLKLINDKTHDWLRKRLLLRWNARWTILSSEGEILLCRPQEMVWPKETFSLQTVTD